MHRIKLYQSYKEVKVLSHQPSIHTMCALAYSKWKTCSWGCIHVFWGTSVVFQQSHWTSEATVCIKHIHLVFWDASKLGPTQIICSLARNWSQGQAGHTQDLGQVMFDTLDILCLYAFSAHPITFDKMKKKRKISPELEDPNWCCYPVWGYQLQQVINSLNI